jgi:hypothetical protein
MSSSVPSMSRKNAGLGANGGAASGAMPLV